MTEMGFTMVKNFSSSQWRLFSSHLPSEAFHPSSAFLSFVSPLSNEASRLPKQARLLTNSLSLVLKASQWKLLFYRFRLIDLLIGGSRWIICHNWLFPSLSSPSARRKVTATFHRQFGWCCKLFALRTVIIMSSAKKSDFVCGWAMTFHYSSWHHHHVFVWRTNFTHLDVAYLRVMRIFRGVNECEWKVYSWKCSECLYIGSKYFFCLPFTKRLFGTEKAFDEWLWNAECLSKVSETIQTVVKASHETFMKL